MYSSAAEFLAKKFNFDAHYFLKGGFWLSLTQAVTIIGGLLTSILFAHYLTPQDFGIYRYLISLSALFAAFSLTGLGQSILQTAAKGYYNFYIETLRLNFIYSLSIFTISFLGFAYYLFNKNIVLAIGCLCIAVLQPIISSFSNTAVYLQGRQLYRESSILQLCKVTVITISGVISIFLTENILVLFIIFLLSNAAVNVLGHIIFKPSNATTTPRELITTYTSYAQHTSLRNVIANAANRVDTIVVFTQLGAAELAIYTIATLVPEQIKGSFKNLASLLLPKYAAHGEYSVIKKSVPKRGFQLFAVLVFLTAIYIFIAPFLYQIIFPKYPEAILLSQLAALAFPSLVLFIPYSVLQSQLAEDSLYSLQITTAIIQAVLTILLTTTFGLIGAIIARIVYRYIFMFLAFYKVLKT